MTKKLQPLFSIGVYASWWIIIFGTAFFAKRIFTENLYMLGFYMGVLIVTYGLYLLLPFILDKKEFRNYLNDIGFIFNKNSIILSILLIVAFIGSIIFTKININIALLPGIAGLNWLIFMQPPLVEELLFRGIIPACFDKYSTFISGVISTILFASLHFRNGLQAILFSAVIGLILFILRVQIKSLVPGIIIHYIINSGVTITLLPLFLIGIVWEIYYFISLYKNKKVREKNKTSLS